MEGLVIKSTGSWYEVQTDAGVKYSCRIRGKLAHCRPQDNQSGSGW